MQEHAPPPYATLSPDHVLDALESVNLRCDGRLLALNSFENRVYQVGQEDGPPLVAKFYRPGRWSDAAILEEHDFTLQLAEREIPVVPPLQIGRRNPASLRRISLCRVPAPGRPSAGTGRSGHAGMDGPFHGAHPCGGRLAALRRIVLRWTFRHLAPNRATYLLANRWLPPDLLPAWESVSQQALEGVQRCFERAGDIHILRLHGDCHMGNVLWTDDGPHFVDFDDSRMGPALQDLWMLLSGEPDSMARQLRDVLAGYEDFFEFNPRELHLLEALRTLRLMHYSAWLARRWDDPAFPAAFPWFNSQHYWQERILELREQIALMDEAPAGAGA